MKPGKIRSIFSQYDTIHRIYLVPEDKAVYERRRKNGGNKKPKYVEGWVEFNSKKIFGVRALLGVSSTHDERKHQQNEGECFSHWRKLCLRNEICRVSAGIPYFSGIIICPIIAPCFVD